MQITRSSNCNLYINQFASVHFSFLITSSNALSIFWKTSDAFIFNI